MTSARIVPLLMLLLGSAQMIADLVGAERAYALAFATCLSPAPKVFTTQAGYEGFSTGFVLEVRTGDGETREVRVTPERYAGVRGPYNRRNAFGAAIAGAPLLVGSPELAPMLEGVTAHALCGEAPLLCELGAAPRAEVVHVRVRFEAREGARSPAPVEVACR